MVNWMCNGNLFAVLLRAIVTQRNGLIYDVIECIYGAPIGALVPRIIVGILRWY